MKRLYQLCLAPTVHLPDRKSIVASMTLHTGRQYVLRVHGRQPRTKTARAPVTKSRRSVTRATGGRCFSWTRSARSVLCEAKPSHRPPPRVSIESLRKVMDMELPPSTAGPISFDDESMSTFWVKALVLLEERHYEMFQKCKFDNRKDEGISVLLYDGVPSALWFVKEGRCFLAVVPTERGLVEINSHIGNHADVFVVRDSSVEGAILVEIKVANAGLLATLVYASQLTFPPDAQHAARMALLGVMKEAPTVSAVAGDISGVAATPHTPHPLDVIGWASVWRKVGDALELNHSAMHQKCTFDDTGAANRMLLYDGVPSALWFMKGGLCFLATFSTKCGAAEIKGLMEGKGIAARTVSLEGCLLINLITIKTAERRNLIVDVLLRSRK